MKDKTTRAVTASIPGIKRETDELDMKLYHTELLIRLGLLELERSGNATERKKELLDAVEGHLDGLRNWVRKSIDDLSPVAPLEPVPGGAALNASLCAVTSPAEHIGLRYRNSGQATLCLDGSIFAANNLRINMEARLLFFEDHIEVLPEQEGHCFSLDHLPLLPAVDPVYLDVTDWDLTTKAIWERWSIVQRPPKEFMVTVGETSPNRKESFEVTATGGIYLTLDPAYLESGDLVLHERYPVCFTKDHMFIAHMPHSHVRYINPTHPLVVSTSALA